MSTNASKSVKVSFSSVQRGADWYLYVIRGNSMVSFQLSAEEWISLRDACYAPVLDTDPAFQALANRDQTPPADADNVGGPAAP